MGIYGNETAHSFQISREQQDLWAVRSHERAIAAMKSGKFAEEIVAVDIPQRKGEPIRIVEDEAPRVGTSMETLAKLRSAFSSDGTITAGNAPGVNDGACALVLMNEERAIREDRKPLATILAHAEVGLHQKTFPKHLD